MTMPMVRLAEASYTVGGADLVGGVDLTVSAGEVVGIIGPNGAGKSTLLELIARELTPTAGRIELLGRDLEGFSLGELATVRSLLPQHSVLRFGFSCLDVVMMGRFPYDESAEEARRHALLAMDATETRHLADRRYPTLSGGEQARIAFTRVLAQGSNILLLDEPTASLDLRHQEMVMREIRARAGGGTAVVAVLHDINLAARFADRVLILDRGRVRAVGTPGAVLQEDVLAAVYGVGVTVMRHPDGDHPLILPRGVAEDG